MNFKTIAFDADDTLWVNETYFRTAEHKFMELIKSYGREKELNDKLFKKEIENLKIYGYGIKGFILSMIECALEVSKNNINPEILAKILDLGKEMLAKPVEVLDGVEEVLQKLQGKYKLIVLTKGDLLDQENKLKQSGLLKYFDCVEVMSNKKEEDYLKLIDKLDIDATELLMIGNSLKSDVLPLIKIGSSAIHIPFHTTWIHERVSKEEESSTAYSTLTSITDVLTIL